MKFFKFFCFVTILFSGVLIAGYSFQRHLIFYPGKLSRDYKYHLTENAEEVFLQTEDGVELNGLFYRGSRPEVILYFHGNAGDLSGWQFIAENFTTIGYNFFIIDYRGYGKSSGTITENGLYLDADAALKFITLEKDILPQHIIIYGRSIGSGVALDLAVKHKTKGLIVEAPYLSLKKLATEKVPYLLPSLWLKFHFNNLAKINLVQSPVLFIHGEKDTLIPPSHSKKLFETFSGKKKLVIIDGGSHNDLDNFKEYHETLNVVEEFFK